MKAAWTLVAIGVCALPVATFSYAFGASQVGTAAGTASLLVTGAGLALVNQASRGLIQQRRTETGRATHEGTGPR